LPVVAYHDDDPRAIAARLGPQSLTVLDLMELRHRYRDHTIRQLTAEELEREAVTGIKIVIRDEGEDRRGAPSNPGESSADHRYTQQPQIGVGIEQEARLSTDGEWASDPSIMGQQEEGDVGYEADVDGEA
jgi:hypothetical protein